MNEISTKSKEICPGVEEQEGQHFTDGSDGPSNPLMLLFLLPQTIEMVDPSHTLDKYSVSVEVDK